MQYCIHSATNGSMGNSKICAWLAPVWPHCLLHGCCLRSCLVFMLDVIKKWNRFFQTLLSLICAFLKCPQQFIKIAYIWTSMMTWSLSMCYVMSRCQVESLQSIRKVLLRALNLQVEPQLPASGLDRFREQWSGNFIDADRKAKDTAGKWNVPIHRNYCRSQTFTARALVSS